MYYTYDENSNVSTVTDLEGNTVYYTYDALDRMTKVKDAASVEAYYEYDAAGQRTRVISGNDSEAVSAYERLGWLESLTNKESDGAIISYFGYDRDDNGNPTVMYMKDGVVVYFEYDAANRLILLISDEAASAQVQDRFSFIAYHPELAILPTSRRQFAGTVGLRLRPHDCRSVQGSSGPTPTTFLSSEVPVSITTRIQALTGWHRQQSAAIAPACVLCAGEGRRYCRRLP